MFHQAGEFAFLLFVWARNSCHSPRRYLPRNSFCDYLATMDPAMPECGGTKLMVEPISEWKVKGLFSTFAGSMQQGGEVRSQ
ncbi:hypothetical protein PRBEI_2000096700 [Prionailurus iriomotensis]